LLKSGTRSRKTIVKEMPMFERVNIWKTQLAYHLASSTLNKEQKAFIVEIMPNIQSMIEASSTLSKEEQVKYAADLKWSILRVFSKMEAFSIFMEIGIQKMVSDDGTSSNSLPQDCNCRWYCSGSGTSCNDLTCDKKNFCGPWGTWECYSKCILE
jgi:hypothetical protein